MFARFLEMTVKPGKDAELLKKLREEVVPILRKHSGFIDVINMEIETEPTKVFAISFWKDKLDAEKYAKETYPKVKAIEEPFLSAPAVVRFCKVDDTASRVIGVAA